MTTDVVALFETPAITAKAVIVNVSDGVTEVGVPEIIPVAVSKTKPAGSVPDIAYVAVAPASARSVVVTGVIAVPTASVTDATDILASGLVINTEDVGDVGPVPAAFVAVAEATY